MISSSGVNNLANDAQFLTLLAQVEPAIVERFRMGGGVPYAYPRFQQIMAESSGSNYYSARKG